MATSGAGYPLGTMPRAVKTWAGKSGQATGSELHEPRGLTASADRVADVLPGPGEQKGIICRSASSKPPGEQGMCPAVTAAAFPARRLQQKKYYDSANSCLCCKCDRK